MLIVNNHDIPDQAQVHIISITHCHLLMFLYMSFVCMYVCMVVCIYVCMYVLVPCLVLAVAIPFCCCRTVFAMILGLSIVRHCIYSILAVAAAVVVIRPPLRIPCCYAASFASLPDIHPALASRPGLTSRPRLPDIPNDASLSLDRNNGPVRKRVRRGPVTLFLARLARSGTKDGCAAS